MGLALTIANHAVSATTARSITAGGGDHTQRLGSLGLGGDGQRQRFGRPGEQHERVRHRWRWRCGWRRRPAGADAADQRGCDELRERRQDLRFGHGAERLDLGRQGQRRGGRRARSGHDVVEGDHRGNRHHAHRRAVWSRWPRARTRMPRRARTARPRRARRRPIGAAVAITLANVTNQALLPAGDIVHAKALTVSATETVNGADAISTYGAQATSGAGGGKISVAGSLGLAVINQTTTAEVAGTVVLTGGDANIIAASNAASTVKAEPDRGRRDHHERRCRRIRRPQPDHRHDHGHPRRRDQPHRRGERHTQRDRRGCGDHRSEDGRERRQGRHRARGRGDALERDHHLAGRHARRRARPDRRIRRHGHPERERLLDGGRGRRRRVHRGDRCRARAHDREPRRSARRRLAASPRAARSR